VQPGRRPRPVGRLKLAATGRGTPAGILDLALQISGAEGVGIHPGRYPVGEMASSNEEPGPPGTGIDPKHGKSSFLAMGMPKRFLGNWQP